MDTTHRGSWVWNSVRCGCSNVPQCAQQSAIENFAPRISPVFGPFMPDTCITIQESSVKAWTLRSTPNPLYTVRLYLSTWTECYNQRGGGIRTCGMMARYLNRPIIKSQDKTEELSRTFDSPHSWSHPPRATPQHTHNPEMPKPSQTVAVNVLRPMVWSRGLDLTVETIIPRPGETHKAPTLNTANLPRRDSGKTARIMPPHRFPNDPMKAISARIP